MSTGNVVGTGLVPFEEGTSVEVYAPAATWAVM